MEQICFFKRFDEDLNKHMIFALHQAKFGKLEQFKH